ncbi:MAG: PGPGW domain-containing protein [Actinomycetota bacterium]|nr:PGPGW domain-containing protein [Actinomycetota bacterium]
MSTQEREATERPNPPEIVVRLRRRREAYVAKSVAYKAAWVIAGLVVLLAGLAMLVTPGPALVVIPIGLAMLSLQFSWAENLLERALERAAGAGAAAKGLSRRQKVLWGAAIVVGVALVVALGVYLWVV